MSESGYKFCKRCSRDRPLVCFGHNRASVDGKAAYCRDCFAKIARDRRAAAAKLKRDAALALEDRHEPITENAE